MEEQAATLEPRDDNPMHVRPTQPYANDPPRREPMKFAFASGARPLDGYSIKRGIGRGGFGEVYYATSDGGKEVALKLIRRNLDIEVRGVSQCLNLKHPHLLALYDIRQDDEDNTWVVMEYVAGETLDEVIDRNPDGLPVPEVLAWMHGIGAGVAYLHDRGIVHRDLKPGNVFSDEGVVKLGDYGLSKFISASRRSGQTESVGTVHYMAPEVANGRYGKEIDIYALGVVLYEMLTGHVPFEGESVGEVLMKHLTAEPDVSRVPKPFTSIVARALDKDPDHRFHTVDELLAALPQPVAGDVRVNPDAIKPPITPTVTTEATRQPQDTPVDAEVIGNDAPGGEENEETSTQDPVLIALRDLSREVSRAWHEANLSTPWRVALIVLLIFVLISGSGIIIAAAVLGSIAYVIYRVIWSLGWIDPRRSAKRTAAPAAGDRPPGDRHPAHDAVDQARAAADAALRAADRQIQYAQGVGSHWRQVAAEKWQNLSPRRRREAALRAHLAKSPREKFADLIGSLLLAAVVAVVASGGSLVLFDVAGSSQVVPVAQLTWMSIVATLGAWGILVPSKLWEGDEGEPAMRRFVMVIMGLLLGTVAFGVERALFVGLPYGGNNWLQVGAPAAAGRLQSVMFEVTGAPTISSNLIYFGLLFLFLRWWKLADIGRRHRFDVWSVAGCALWAYILAEVISFPSAWGAGLAAVIAASVQLASPRIEPKPRHYVSQAA